VGEDSGDFNVKIEKLINDEVPSLEMFYGRQR